MFFIPNFLLSLLLLATCLYLWIRQKRRYWSNLGVPSDATSLIFAGYGEHIAKYTERIYRRYKNSGSRFAGTHLFLQPVAVVVDLDLVRNILSTDFEIFHDRGLYHNVREDPLSGNIVRLSGEPWKRLRAKLTPTFTSAKMRYMSGTLLQVAERFTEIVSELVQDQGAVLEIRELCNRFTTDVIGLVAFGIECDSLREPNTKFRLMGDKAVKSSNPLKEVLGKTFPSLARHLQLRVFSQEIMEFYKKIITENVEYREKHQIRRNDFLDILIELKNSHVGGEFSLTLNEIIAQSFVFFIGGSDTSSNIMSFCLYELSQNQHIQQRAREEVMQCLEQHDNQLTYECIKDMKYLEQIVSETLRKYPVGPILQRVPYKNYTVPQSKQVIEKDVKVLVPIYAIHHDPEIYPKPEIFDPERFNSAEVKARHPFAYLPFGAGPRICIAERFGKMQTMIGIAMLLRHFRFSNSLETPHVLEFDIKRKNGFSAAGGVPLKVNKI